MANRRVGFHDVVSDTDVRNKPMLSCGKAFVIVTTLLLAVSLCAAAPKEATLAVGGKATVKVVVAPNASEQVKQSAGELAEMLGRITGGEFEVTEGDGATGLAVGTATDFPALGLTGTLKVKTLADEETYILRSHAKGVHLVGATPVAAGHAVWDLLYRLGYRQFFPTEAWEVVPVSRGLAIAVDVRETPAFFARLLGYDYGYWDYNRDPFERWQWRNRVRSNFRVVAGHAYGSIVQRNKAEFEKHPEYLGLVDGERKSSKMCISNPGLQQLVIDHALRYFEEKPDERCISMEPSDGAGWCECDGCNKLGSISNRAATLSNAVAKALREKLGDRYVGMLAYNYHAVPLTIPVEPTVIVRVTTHQARGGMKLEGRIRGWAKQGALVGVSDAYCTFVWDWLLPASQRGSDLTYIRRTIPEFHELGAKSIGGWTSDSWGTVGLGNYVAARILWDVREADRVDEIVEDFLEKSFGPAREPMGKFYRLIYRTKPDEDRPQLSEDLIGRMYRYAKTALDLAGDDAKVSARIGNLVLYTRYVELFFNFQNAKGKDRQAAYETLLRFSYRIRKTEMVHSKAVWCGYLELRDKKLTRPEGCTWGTPPEEDPWKEDRPYSEDEVLAVLNAGIAANPLLDFQPRQFSEDLAPARGLRLKTARKAYLGVQRGQHVQRLYTWVERAPAEIKLEVTGGLIAHYRNRGNVRLALHSPKAVSNDALYLVATDESTPPDGNPHEVVIKTPYPGLHWLEVRSGGDRSRVKFVDSGMPCTVETHKFAPGMQWSAYFYVPKGTRMVGGYAGDPRGKILDGDGKVIYRYEDLDKPGHFSVPVPSGQDGRLWRFEATRGNRLLLTVPPCLAETADELLLPKEVVEADK